MAVSLFFGLPGCGKTTTLAMIALKAIKKNKYEYVYSNVRLGIPGVTFIDNDIIGGYQLQNCLLLIDEATLFADNRDYKSFSKDRIQYFLEHRHYNADIILFTQQWDAVDRKIRVITDRVYYIYKGLISGHWVSKIVRIPYGLLFPDKKNGEKLGEIVQGYSKPSLISRLFAKLVYRPKYYQYFDSWEAPELKPIPSKYQPYPGSLKKPTPIRDFLRTKSFRKRKERRSPVQVIDTWING